MNNINIQFIHPALKIITKQENHLMIANTSNGTHMGYFPKENSKFKLFLKSLHSGKKVNLKSDPHELYLRLYRNSIEYSNHNLKDKIYHKQLHINTDVNSIVRTLKVFEKKTIGMKNTSLHMKIPITIQNVNTIIQRLDHYQKLIHDITEKKKISVFLKFTLMHDSSWDKNLFILLERSKKYPFIHTCISIPAPLLLENDSQLSAWLNFLQDSGYSFPFTFSHLNILTTRRGVNIIQYLYKSGLASYIEFDHNQMVCLRDKYEIENYIENYRNAIINWIKESSINLLFLKDFVILSHILTEPDSKSIIYSLLDLSSLRKKWLSNKNLKSLCEKFIGIYPFMKNLLYKMLPFHIFQNDKREINIIDLDFSEFFTKICSLT